MSLAVHYTLPLFTKIGTLYPFLACKHADRKSYILKILEVLCPDYNGPFPGCLRSGLSWFNWWVSFAPTFSGLSYFQF